MPSRAVQASEGNCLLRRAILLLPAFIALFSAHAAVVRGHVTTQLGVPAPGARVQLIRLSGGARSVADAIAGPDGEFELRTELAGRFLLLTSPSLLSTTLAPQLGPAFYAGRTDLLTRDIALNGATILPEKTVAATPRDTPLAQLSSADTLLAPTQLLTQASVLPSLEAAPGVFLVQRGQTGTPATLYLRGAPPEATQLTLDGLPIEDLGGGFNLSTLATTGLATANPVTTVELLPGPEPLHAVDAEAGLLALATPGSASIRPSLTFAGDAGPLATLRSEGTVSASPNRADLLATFSRFDTANVASPYHLATAAANLGYHISAATSLRVTAHRDVQASAFTLPIDLFGLPPIGKQSAQDTYATFTFATSTARHWHNAAAYGLARKRTELQLFQAPAAGLPVTIVGANGYAASGIAAVPALAAREDDVTSRDEFSFQSDRTLKPWLTPLLLVRYQDERAADITPGGKATLERHHLSAAFGLTGQFRARVFYQASGFVDHSPTFGFTGAPRLGLTYAPVRPGTRRLRGTTLHATAATGERETSLAEGGNIAPRTRSFEVSADQVILPRKLSLRATYFHNQFSHQFEPLTTTLLAQTLAFRTQGLESALRYEPGSRLLVTAGYSYLAALTEQSAATPVFNPAYPTLPIGALTALTGSRPFHRPPNTGFVNAAYTGPRLTASFEAGFAGRSDDSTNLPQSPGLLLPNRNLSPAYAALSASASYAVSRRITIYSQLTNLADGRHIAPIGYQSTPFVIRTGLRFRLGGE